MDTIQYEKPSIKNLIILAVFVVSVQMYTLEIAGNGVTANYAYLLFPFIFWFTGVKRRLVGRVQVVQIVLIFIFIYFMGFSSDLFELNSDPIRRLTSFLAFLFPLLLSFIEFKTDDISIFKKAIIIASVYYSLNQILLLRSLSGIVGLWDLKGSIGSQRYGFILCLGFFISLFNDELIFKKWILLQRVFICSIILMGAILTFSKSSIVSLIGGFLFFLISAMFKRNHRTKDQLDLKKIKKKIKPIHMIALIVLTASTYTAFQYYFDTNYLSYYQTAFTLSSGEVAEGGLENSESSEGFRYYMLMKIIDYLSAHPLFGSCYQGVYLIFEEFRDGGSTHNQYTDVFLRTGLIGGTLWLFLLYRILRFCSNDKGLQVGLVAILIYGFFHETFKESQGSFVFGMLLSFSYMSVALKQRVNSPVLAPLVPSELP